MGFILYVNLFWFKIQVYLKKKVGTEAFGPHTYIQTFSKPRFWAQEDLQMDISGGNPTSINLRS